MAMAMAPPAMGGFSLRVQLFSPTAHELTDKPIRLFRVVISKEATMRDFCQEASRIHMINYGAPIAIKKCQDDQGFDITQTDIIGDIFTDNRSLVRVIQTTSSPSARDSIPPNSGLRFDPGISTPVTPVTKNNGKRDRESTIRPNGFPAGSLWNPSKRQKVADIDPDQPVPTLESGANAGSATERRSSAILPPAQVAKVGGGNQAKVRPVIPETPPPEGHLADEQHLKPTQTNGIQQSRPILPPNGTAQASGRTDKITPARIVPGMAPISRGRTSSVNPVNSMSVGEVNRTPVEPRVDRKSPQVPGSRKRLSSSATPQTNGRTPSRSANEASVYEIIDTDNEAPPAVAKKAKTTPRKLNSPSNSQMSSMGTENFKTPPMHNNWTTHASNHAHPLPLTPGSREREEKQKQLQRAAEARLLAKMSEMDARRRAEEEEKRQAEIRARATSLEKERVERENARLLKLAEEQARLKELQDRTDALDREKKENAEKERQEKRQQDEADERKKAATAIKPPPKQTPIRPRQSSTAFIPSGRKSALKPGSSPVPPRADSTVSSGDGDFLIQPSHGSVKRKVSFHETVHVDTFVDQPETATRISATLPPALNPAPSASSVASLPGNAPQKGKRAPILPGSKPSPRVEESTPSLSKSTPVPSTKTRIPPPMSMSSIKPGAKIQPKNTPKSAISSTKPTERRQSSSKPATFKDSGNLAPVSASQSAIVEISSEESKSEEYDDSDESDNDVSPNVEMLNKVVQKRSPDVKPDAETTPKMGEVETASVSASSRESRSPVRFTQQPTTNIIPPKSQQSNPIDEDATQSYNDSSSSEGGDGNSSSSEEEEDEDEEEMEEEEAEETSKQESTKPSSPATRIPQSSLELPQKPGPRRSPAPAATKKNPQRKKSPTSSPNSPQSIQDQIDSQLTSSQYEAHSSGPPKSTTPIPPPPRLGNRPPASRIGASLSSLNANAKKALVSSPITSSQPPNGIHTTSNLKHKLNSNESDSDSSSEAESDSESDNDATPVRAPPPSAQKAAARVPLPSSDSDDSSDDEEASERKLNEQMRSKLQAELAGVGSQSSVGGSQKMGSQKSCAVKKGRK